MSRVDRNLHIDVLCWSQVKNAKSLSDSYRARAMHKSRQVSNMDTRPDFAYPFFINEFYCHFDQWPSFGFSVLEQIPYVFLSKPFKINDRLQVEFEPLISFTLVKRFYHYAIGHLCALNVRYLFICNYWLVFYPLSLVARLIRI